MDGTQFAPHFKKLECPIHGTGFETFVCEHLVSNLPKNGSQKNKMVTTVDGLTLGARLVRLSSGRKANGTQIMRAKPK